MLSLLSPKEKLVLQVRSPGESPNPWKKGERKLRMPLLRSRGPSCVPSWQHCPHCTPRPGSLRP